MCDDHIAFDYSKKGPDFICVYFFLRIRWNSIWNVANSAIFGTWFENLFHRFKHSDQLHFYYTKKCEMAENEYWARFGLWWSSVDTSQRQWCTQIWILFSLLRVWVVRRSKWMWLVFALCYFLFVYLSLSKENVQSTNCASHWYGLKMPLEMKYNRIPTDCFHNESNFFPHSWHSFLQILFLLNDFEYTIAIAVLCFNCQLFNSQRSTKIAWLHYTHFHLKSEKEQTNCTGFYIFAPVIVGIIEQSNTI